MARWWELIHNWSMAKVRAFWGRSEIFTNKIKMLSLQKADKFYLKKDITTIKQVYLSYESS